MIISVISFTIFVHFQYLYFVFSSFVIYSTRRIVKCEHNFKDDRKPVSEPVIQLEFRFEVMLKLSGVFYTRAITPNTIYGLTIAKLCFQLRKRERMQSVIIGMSTGLKQSLRAPAAKVLHRVHQLSSSGIDHHRRHYHQVHPSGLKKHSFSCLKIYQKAFRKRASNRTNASLPKRMRTKIEETRKCLWQICEVYNSLWYRLDNE